MRIRLAVAEDSVSAVDVVRAVFDEYAFTWDEADYHADLYDLSAAYIEPGHPFWIAENGNGVAMGTVALDLFEPIPGQRGYTVEFGGHVRISGCDCGLLRLYVKPEARRCGVGSALMETVIREACRRELAAMEIWSDKRFGEAHRLYQKLGAVVVGDRICHDPDQSPEWGLILDLPTRS